MDAGIPEVELQNWASGGQWASTWGQSEVLKASFSGPCSWTMEAEQTAVGSEGSSTIVTQSHFSKARVRS